jgi:phospholipid/cholesterol/gamma-HCH transport system ATP-binding protein
VNRSQALDPVHVRVVDLKKSYGDHVVLDGVTFDIYRGLTNVIVGGSGSGKTVLLRQLLRIEKPDAGRIEVDGLDLVPLSEVALTEVRRKFAVVFQGSALFDSMTVFDNVAFPLRERHEHVSAADIRRRVEERLEALGVLHAADKLPSELSGGMRKRVAVARALVVEPSILVYDEPTTGLDPITARTVDELIESTRQKFGVTSLVISHDVQSVLTIAHHVNLLYKGRMEASLPRDEFVISENREVRRYLDASGVRLTADESGPQRRIDSGLRATLTESDLREPRRTGTP